MAKVIEVSLKVKHHTTLMSPLSAPSPGNGRMVGNTTRACPHFLNLEEKIGRPEPFDHGHLTDVACRILQTSTLQALEQHVSTRDGPLKGDWRGVWWESLRTNKNLPEFAVCTGGQRRLP